MDDNKFNFAKPFYDELDKMSDEELKKTLYYYLCLDGLLEGDNKKIIAKYPNLDIRIGMTMLAMIGDMTKVIREAEAKKLSN